MMVFEDALRTVLSQIYNFEIERVVLPSSLGRVLAEDVFSDLDMPPFDKSAVDGYACRISDIVSIDGTAKHDNSLQIVETIQAGVVPQKKIHRGECSKIMTGSMVPPGADCVVMVENSESAGENHVRFIVDYTGTNICYRGEDIKNRELVLSKGTQIMPAQIAVMSSVGAINPSVAKLPKVGIISTGDELVEPDITPGMARIRNSNAWQLAAQVKSVPALSCYFGIAPDTGYELRKVIELAMETSDVVLLTGGVSMGDFDFVPAILQEASVDIFFKSLAIQPGKPTVFGRRNDTFVFALPGNPVSSFVIFEILVKPFLFHMMGCSKEPLAFTLPMGTEFSRRRSERKSFIPVIMKDGSVFPAEYHGSAHINAFTLANGIMSMEIGINGVKKGELVNVRPL
jgi:molybdopterin molybdotransferase